MDCSVKKIVVTAFSFIALISSFTSYASKDSGVKQLASGTITFTGAIVAAPCIITKIEQSIDTKCWNEEGKVKTSSMDIKKISEKKTQLPNQQGVQYFKWINKENKTGIYTVIYE
ncbi:fimbrial protein [Providencia rustigianii]|uniref:hypothetical protein n=1 Tax=Providencia rustigianii TaxID=158850 RepID=UPI00223F1BF7|nr:hypothetical protein [Providencia rustigianii]